MAEATREVFIYLLECLRGSQMGWIAEEIEAEVATGRLVEKETMLGRRAESGLALQEFSEPERLEIALRIVSERARVGYSLWRDAQTYLGRVLDVDQVTFAEDDGPSVSPPFESDFPEALAVLDKAIDMVVKECSLTGPELTKIARPTATSLGKVE